MSQTAVARCAGNLAGAKLTANSNPPKAALKAILKAYEPSPSPALPPSHATDLFVGIDKDDGILELLLFKDCLELLTAGGQPVHIAAVHHIDDGLGAAGQRAVGSVL